MNADHHLNRSQRYLNFTPANLAAGDYARAARALCRAATHAVTAAAVHWQHRRNTKRRLHIVVAAMRFDGHLSGSHRRTFRDVLRLPEQLANTPGAAHRLLSRARRRVRQLRAAIAAAIASHPNPPTWDPPTASHPGPPTREPAKWKPAITPNAALPAPLTAVGPLRQTRDRCANPDCADPPPDCPGCRSSHPDSIPPPAFLSIPFAHRSAMPI